MFDTINFMISISKIKLMAGAAIGNVTFIQLELPYSFIILLVTESANRKLKFDSNFVFMFLLQNSKLIERCKTKVDAVGEAA